MADPDWTLQKLDQNNSTVDFSGRTLKDSEAWES